MPDHNDNTFILNSYNTDDITITTDSNMSDYIIDINSVTTSTIDTTSWDLTFSDDNTIDLDNLTITLNEPVEFEDNMPDVAKVEDMCNDYPALRKAYENFKTIYKMVHQDWQGKQDDDEHFPF